VFHPWWKLATWTWTLSGTVCAWQRPPTIRTKNLPRIKTRGCQCSFRLLMMGGVSPETCWASYNYGIIKFDTLLHLVGFFLWIVLRCTDPRTSNSISVSDTIIFNKTWSFIIVRNVGYLTMLSVTEIIQTYPGPTIWDWIINWIWRGRKRHYLTIRLDGLRKIL